MQMRTRYFLVIRISVRGAIEVEAHEVRAIATLPPGSGNLRDIDISHLKNFC
jgi:hypothetical protein